MEMGPRNLGSDSAPMGAGPEAGGKQARRGRVACPADAGGARELSTRCP